MEIISLGWEFASKLVNNKEIYLQESVLGADILFLDFYYDDDYIKRFYNADVLGSLPDKYKKKLESDINRVALEVQEILKKGGSVFALLSGITNSYISQRELYNRILFNGYGDSYFTPISSKSDNIEIENKEPFKSFFEKNINFFAPEAYIRPEYLPNYVEDAHYEGGVFKALKIMPTALLKVKKSNAVLALHYGLKSGGNLFLIPSLKYEDAYRTIKAYDSEEEIFLSSIVELVNSLKVTTDDCIYPAWVESFTIFDEKEKRKKIEELEKQVIKTNKAIAKENEQISKHKKLKLLLFADGKPLEDIVKFVFNDLGCKMVDNICKNRVDLVFGHKNKTFVCEIKGKKSSAAEKDVRQLKTWVSECENEQEKDMKGLLIVNTFKELPLKNRKENPFPFADGSVVQKNNFCLITTLQLLCLYIDCKNNPNKIDKVINEIYDCTGVYEKYKDWEKYIEAYS